MHLCLRFTFSTMQYSIAAVMEVTKCISERKTSHPVRTGNHTGH